VGGRFLQSLERTGDVLEGGRGGRVWPTCTGFSRILNSFSRSSPMLFPLRVLASTSTGVLPCPQEEPSYNKQTNKLTVQSDSIDPFHRSSVVAE